jgi:hypothetical protein
MRLAELIVVPEDSDPLDVPRHRTGHRAMSDGLAAPVVFNQPGEAGAPFALLAHAGRCDRAAPGYTR